MKRKEKNRPLESCTEKEKDDHPLPTANKEDKGRKLVASSTSYGFPVGVAPLANGTSREYAYSVAVHYSKHQIGWGVPTRPLGRQDRSDAEEWNAMIKEKI